MRRTLLGRVRILARRGDQVREIVLDPRNGTILRDYSSTGGPNLTGGGNGSGSGSGGGRQDDDGDDDDGDDDDDDDDDDD